MSLNIGEQKAPPSFSLHNSTNPADLAIEILIIIVGMLSYADRMCRIQCFSNSLMPRYVYHRSRNTQDAFRNVGITSDHPGTLRGRVGPGHD